MEYQFRPSVSQEAARKSIEKQGIEVEEIRTAGPALAIRTKALDESKEKSVRTALERDLNTKITVLHSETVGPVIGAETLRKTAIAAALAIIGILLYIAYAFKNFNFALSAVIALIHDVLVVIGCYSVVSHFFGAELDTLFVTALLTTMSFSVHDTIIVFDQIRDYKKRQREGSIEDFANKALTETLVRSFNNSVTIIFMMLALVLLGGSTIRFFAVALLIGSITGVYSSPFVATPIAVWLEKSKK